MKILRNFYLKNVCVVAAAIQIPNKTGIGSGGSTHVYEVIEGLKSNDFNIRLFCARGLNQRPIEIKKDLTIYRIFNWQNAGFIKTSIKDPPRNFKNESSVISKLKIAYRFFRDVFYTIQLVILNLSNKPLVVYERTSSSTLSGTYYAFLMNIPLVLEINDLSYKNFSLSNAKFIVTPSLNVIPKKFNKKCILLPWGVNVDHFSQRNIKKLPFPFKSNLNTKIVVLFTGSFLSWHGLNDLIDAAKKICKDFNSIIFLIIGDGPEKSNVEAYVKFCKLTNYFLFTGFVPYNELPQFMALADIGVAPYNSELSGKRADIAVPLKVLEYMSMGLPVVVSESGNSQNLVDSGINGIVYPTDDTQELARAITKLIYNKQSRRKLGYNARKKIMANYSWRSHCDKISNIISLASK